LPRLTRLSRLTCFPLFAHIAMLVRLALSAGVALLISTFARIVRAVALLGGIARLTLRPSLISRLLRILTIAVAFAARNSGGAAFSRTASATTAPSTTPTAPTTARLAARATIRAIAATAIHALLTSAFYATLHRSRSQWRYRLNRAVCHFRRAHGLRAVGLRVALIAAAIVTATLSRTLARPSVLIPIPVAIAVPSTPFAAATAAIPTPTAVPTASAIPITTGVAATAAVTTPGASIIRALTVVPVIATIPPRSRISVTMTST
jgi:hypothetical protein